MPEPLQSCWTAKKGDSPHFFLFVVFLCIKKLGERPTLIHSSQHRQCLYAWCCITLGQLNQKVCNFFPELVHMQTAAHLPLLIGLLQKKKKHGSVQRMCFRVYGRGGPEMRFMFPYDVISGKERIVLFCFVFFVM